MKDRIKALLSKAQKPARYCGGELNSVVKDKGRVDVRFAFCFPDIYEVGMSHLGMKILYGLLNEREDVWCERVFAPWEDMEEEMRGAGVPLFALESQDRVADFDIIGFTLQYELCYTTVLNMLDLAGLPVRAADRKALTPLVIGGGPCACNPEPVAEFFDLFVLGEGEEVILELIDLYKEHKRAGSSKEAFLRQAAKIEGVYVPSLYSVSYNPDGTVREVAARDGAPEKIKKRIIKNLDKSYYPDKFVVPFIDIVHDRAMAELMRGCIRGCRFCQAGFIYRPAREKSPETVDRQGRALCESTGYDEVSLSSLSSTDYRKLNELMKRMTEWADKDKVSMTLPSLRVDKVTPEIVEQLKKVRRGGLTFAPEAGTQRMRDIINKNVTEEQLLETCKIAFEAGWTAVKLYFMIGLPFETMEDVEGIVRLAQRLVDLYYSIPTRQKGRPVKVTVSVASFVPKPFTPFQWEPQDSPEMLREKQARLLEVNTSKHISKKWHESGTSLIEAILARGDRRLCGAIERAWRKGCRLDSWEQFFSLDAWLRALEEEGLSGEFYANRRREINEVLPWDHLDFGVTKSFLLRELQLAQKAVATGNCREKCSGCGLAAERGGVCLETGQDMV